VHTISIPASITQRVIGRRGKLKIYERLEGPRTALVVIDLQNAFLLEGMPSYIRGATGLIPHVNKLAAALRSVGGTVAWLQHTYDPLWSVYADFSNPAHLEAIAMAYTPGHPGHELHGDLAVRDNDLVLPKRRFSAFIQGSSDLDARLRDKGVDTVIVTGVASNSCCESTARDAMMLNYRTLFVSDANGTRSDDEHNATLANMLRLFADVAATDEIVSRLR
jgi:ureidoacrylate peracid hydrolase